ncbi:Rne/Rng family ribonuclease [Chitinivibrio alkaliphilus]|uniref:Ribonuclease G n=1 Tax=Chitinivibrio alkaliphilus ACht1 TaxID=1313304 RepID=U7D5U5_9BACT|nr:Rne/Rng family ribonuclease [Chitinivibrio alkaliphilus]ERP31869.1 ribonuclease, Rne/Rng family [Chitinivibrio alkaliphilus ACht1]
MSKKIILSSSTTQKRAALLEEGRVVELVVEQPDSKRILGNIYRGTVTKIVPGIQSAFVDIGIGQNGFLHISDVDPTLLPEGRGGAKKSVDAYLNRSHKNKRNIPLVPIEHVLEEGQQILVQVIKEPISDKSPKLSTQISLAGRFVVLVPDSHMIGVSKRTEDENHRRKLKKIVRSMLPPGLGCIVRTIGLRVSSDHIRKELQTLVNSWHAIQTAALEGIGPKKLYTERGVVTQVVRDLFSRDVQEIIVDSSADYEEVVDYLEKVSPEMVERISHYESDIPLFDAFDIERDLDKSIKRKVWLHNGGYLYFDHTEALIAIDVNTGRNKGSNNLENTVFETNLAACYEIGRQLRLRDIGGIIVVDFIDMKNPRNRKKIEETMRAVLDKDTTTTNLTRLSKFGLMEITRKRVRPELQELLTDVCPACSGLGRVFSPATLATRIERWLHRAAADDTIARRLSINVPLGASDYLLDKEKTMIEDLESQHGFRLRIVADYNLDQDEFEVYPLGKTDPITEKHI